MRHSNLALVLIKLRINSEPYLVLIRDEKWDEWTLVGGHVEKDEENDWARAAARECNEELSPLRFGVDFTLLPLLDQPTSWGPVSSKSAGGELTTYTAQFFALRFLKAPSDCLDRLARENFLLVPESSLGEPTGTVAQAKRALGTLRRADVAWDSALSSAPLRIEAATA